MSMYNNFKDVLDAVNFDETLLRLLYYPPANLATNTPDPLDSSLPNIMDMNEEQQWNIRNQRIIYTDKTDDLVNDNPICRLLIYAGRRSANNGNFLFADQEIYIDILCHYSFQNGDLRIERIADRLNQIFVLERITGIGKTDYVNGIPWGSPKEYMGFRLIYKFGDFKK